jgi:hypothetical protein
LFLITCPFIIKTSFVFAYRKLNKIYPYIELKLGFCSFKRFYRGVFLVYSRVFSRFMRFSLWFSLFFCSFFAVSFRGFPRFFRVLYNVVWNTINENLIWNFVHSDYLYTLKNNIILSYVEEFGLREVFIFILRHHFSSLCVLLYYKYSFRF